MKYSKYDFQNDKPYENNKNKKVIPSPDKEETI